MPFKCSSLPGAVPISRLSCLETGRMTSATDASEDRACSVSQSCRLRDPVMSDQILDRMFAICFLLEIPLRGYSFSKEIL